MLIGIIRMLLVNDPDVKFLTGERVYHHLAEQGVSQPHIVLSLISSEHPRTIEGASTWVRGRIQVDVFGTELYQWRQLVERTAKAIEGYADDHAGMVRAGQLGIDISYIELTEQADRDMAPREGQGGPAWRGTRMDFQFMYTIRPATPAGA